MNLFEGRLPSWRHPIVRKNQEQVREEFCKENGHEFSLKSEEIGDCGVVNGTQINYGLECDNCGERKEATYADIEMDYDD